MVKQKQKAYFKKHSKVKIQYSNKENCHTSFKSALDHQWCVLQIL